MMLPSFRQPVSMVMEQRISAMAVRAVVLAFLSIALIVSGIGLAYVHLALPAVILGGLGFLAAVGWFGSVLFEEPTTSRSPREAERQRIRRMFDQIRHNLPLKY